MTSTVDMDQLGRALEQLVPRLQGVYEDLHAHPELGFAEHRTAGVAADALDRLGFDVTTGVGGTGIVATMGRDDGPPVLLRADMDALPVEEATGLPYASTVRAVDPDGVEVPVAHACGHDMHVTWLLGVAELLAADRVRDDIPSNHSPQFAPVQEPTIGAGIEAMYVAARQWLR